MSCIFLFLTILKKQEINNGPWQAQGFFFFLEFGNPGQVNKKKKIIEHQVEGCKPGSA